MFPRDIIILPLVGQDILLSDKYTSDLGDFCGIYSGISVLENPSLFTPNVKTWYEGSAELVFGEPGFGQILPVCIARADFVEENGKTVFTDGFSTWTSHISLKRSGLPSVP